MKNSFNIPVSFKIDENLEVKIHEYCANQNITMSYLFRQGVNSIIYGNRNTTDITNNHSHGDEW